jgi:hypothetical protein
MSNLLITAVNYFLWNSYIYGIHRLTIFENRVLRRTFVPSRKEVTVDWTRLHNEEAGNLHSSIDIIRIIKSRIML